MGEKECIKARKVKVAAPSVYAGKFGEKSKRSRKWHFFVGPFSGKMNVYLFTVFV